MSREPQYQPEDKVLWHDSVSGQIRPSIIKKVVPGRDATFYNIWVIGDYWEGRKSHRIVLEQNLVPDDIASILLPELQ